MVRESGAADRRWKGDGNGPVVTYRSMAGTPYYRVHPSTQFDDLVRCTDNSAELSLLLHLEQRTVSVPVLNTALGRAYRIRVCFSSIAFFHETWRVSDHLLIRSLQVHAGSVKYIWPLQTAVSDCGAQRRRLDAIRKELGWRVIGCNYIECYS